MKKTVFFVFLFIISLSLCGCSNLSSHNQITNVKETISKVQTIVSQVTVVPTKSLLIDDLMDENEIVTTSSEQTSENYDEYNFSNGTNISKYVAKLYSLTSIAQKSINLNQNTEYLISCVNSKSNSLKDICNAASKKDCEISKSNSSALYDLCESILTNINRLNLAKDDVRNETSQIVALKNNYTSNIEKLSGKYSKLVSSIETRNNYLDNICYSFDKIHDIVISIYYPNAQEKTQSAWSNVDTYNSSNTRTKRQVNRQVVNEYNNANNQYGFGYGGTNPYYGYGMFGGFGGMGRYPYSPYTNYNPYIPNIDTFGTYKNIDTYKPITQNQNDNTNKSDEEQQEKPYYPYETYENYRFSKNFNEPKMNTEKIHIKKIDDKPKIKKLEKIYYSHS